MIFLFYLFIFLFGAIIGSFLNVVICRLATRENIIKKRSHCPKCGYELAWYDLIPIISFFALRGRCRQCGERISWQYPAVEAATGLLFLANFIFLFPELVEGSDLFLISNFEFRIFTFCYLLYVACSLIVIFVYDLRHYIIPDAVLWPAIGVSLLWRVFLSLEVENWSLFGHWSLVIGHFWPYLLAVLVACAFFLAIIAITKGKGMGLGDAKLAVLMGLLLGWPNILLALFLAFFSGAAVGVGLIALGKKKMKSQIPFGPFLIIGAITALFWGQKILTWYQNILDI